jgi:hypothetical protein
MPLLWTQTEQERLRADWNHFTTYDAGGHLFIGAFDISAKIEAGLASATIHHTPGLLSATVVSVSAMRRRGLNPVADA